MSDLVARVTQAITMALILAVDEDCRACALTDEERAELARAIVALIRPVTLEEAAKVCDVIEDKLTEQWKAGYKVCDYTQGASDGANDCAAAIRALKDKS